MFFLLLMATMSSNLLNHTVCFYFIHLQFNLMKLNTTQHNWCRTIFIICIYAAVFSAPCPTPRTTQRCFSFAIYWQRSWKEFWLLHLILSSFERNLLLHWPEKESDARSTVNLQLITFDMGSSSGSQAMFKYGKGLWHWLSFFLTIMSSLSRRKSECGHDCLHSGEYEMPKALAMQGKTAVAP